jgi:hypothetical protein
MKHELKQCFQNGLKPTCKHWSRDYVGFLCHDKNCITQKCTGYEEAQQVIQPDNGNTVAG